MKNSDISNILTEAAASSMDGVTIADLRAPDMPLVYVNQAFEKITGYPSHEVLGRNCRFLQGEETDQQTAMSLANAIENGEEIRTTIRNYRKNGQAFWNELHLIPVKAHGQDVTHYLGVQKDMNAQKILPRPLSMQLMYDPLTNFPNQNRMIEYIRALPESDNITLIFIRINQIKELEVIYDTEFCRYILNNTGKFLLGIIGDNSNVFRLGSYDFCITHRGNLPKGDADKLCQSIFDHFKRPFTTDRATIKLDVYIGIVPSGESTQRPETLVQKAEIAMMLNNKDTNNRVDIYGPESIAKVERTLQLIADIGPGIENKEFEVHYQAQIALDKNIKSGCEALARWYHRDFGYVSPGEFIELAENHDLIFPLTCFILSEVCKTQKQLQATGIYETIAVNLSPKLLSMQGVADKLKRIVDEHNIESEYIELEIVENAKIEKLSHRVIKNLDEIRKHGFPIAIDDFGTGYSSLSYLRRMPVQKIKIDKEFIDDIGLNSESEIVITSLITLCKALGFQVVAEGVEHQHQVEHLKNNKCDIIQGYFFSKPLPLDEYIKFKHT